MPSITVTKIKGVKSNFSKREVSSIYQLLTDGMKRIKEAKLAQGDLMDLFMPLVKMAIPPLAEAVIRPNIDQYLTSPRWFINDKI
jgi:hypothetical protein